MISTISMIRLGKTFGEPDGRRLPREREAARRASARIVALATGAPRERGRRGAAAPRTATRRWRSSRSSPESTPRPRGRGSRRPAATSGRRSSDEARRRGRARRRRAPSRATSRSSTGGSRRVGLASADGRGIAVPGFVDLQVNGFGGVDFLEADADGYRARRRGAARDRRHRLPADADHRRRRSTSSRRSREVPLDGRRARGSSASTSRARSSRRSAWARIRRRPGATPTRRCSSACSRPGPVRLITLAPELPGALRADRRCSTRAASSSPAATPTRPREEANAAFDRGVRTVTHLFNAMRPFRHRDPGIVGAALARDGRRRPDHRRRHPPRPRHGARSSGRRPPGASRSSPTRSRARARRDGAYSLGERRPRSSATASSAAPDGVLAGSVADDDRGGAEPARARRAARATRSRRRPRSRPRVLGLSDVGRIDVGRPRRPASSLDDNLEIERVLVGRRGACRRLSRRRARAGRAVPRGDPRAAAGAASACSSTRRVRARRGDRARARARIDPHGRPRLVRQRRLLRRSTPSACCRGWTALRDSITLTVYYEADLDMSGSTVIAPLAVGADARRRSSTSTRARDARSLHGRGHERPGLGARAGGRGGAPARRGAGARGRGDEDVHEPGRRARAPRRARGGRGPALRRRAPRGDRPARGADPGARAVGRAARAAVRVRRPDVRDRPRHRVRDGARDRAEAARDLPRRGRAADRDRARARSGRRARPALPGLGDRLARRDAAGRGRGRRRAIRAAGATLRRERDRRRRDRRRRLRRSRSRRRRCRCSRRSSRSSRASSSPGRSPARRASTPTCRAA